MDQNSKRIKNSEILFCLGILITIAYQLLDFFSSGCVVPFVHFPRICGSSVKYGIIVLLIFELAFPVLIFSRVVRILRSKR